MYYQHSEMEAPTQKSYVLGIRNIVLMLALNTVIKKIHTCNTLGELWQLYHVNYHCNNGSIKNLDSLKPILSLCVSSGIENTGYKKERSAYYKQLDQNSMTKVNF